MTSRRWMVGTVVVAGLALLGVATAFAVGPAARHGMMKRMASAMIDEALDRAQVTPEQRAQIHASRDRAFAAIEAHANGRQAHMEQMLALFEADRMDAAQVAALHAEREADHRQVAQAIGQAIVEAHGVLTPDQRKSVAGFVRDHHRGHMH